MHGVVKDEGRATVWPSSMRSSVSPFRSHTKMRQCGLTVIALLASWDIATPHTVLCESGGSVLRVPSRKA